MDSLGIMSPNDDLKKKKKKKKKGEGDVAMKPKVPLRPF